MRMKLNHLTLVVTKPSETARFLETYFGMRNLGEPYAERAGMVFLMDDDGLVLTLIKAGKAGAHYPPGFHIGFIQPSEARVNALYECLKADGFATDPPQRSHAWTFYFQAPGGFTIEVLS
jgi:lactoylglutathione lyase